MLTAASWAPSWRQVVLELAVAGLVLAGAAGTDPAGRVLGAVAVLALLAAAGRDALLRPVLTAGPDGLSVRVGWRLVQLPWAEVGVQLVRDRRSPAVQLELAGKLVVLGRWRLGAPPEQVYKQLTGVPWHY